MRRERERKSGKCSEDAVIIVYFMNSSGSGSFSHKVIAFIPSLLFHCLPLFILQPKFGVCLLSAVHTFNTSFSAQSSLNSKAYQIFRSCRSANAPNQNPTPLRYNEHQNDGTFDKEEEKKFSNVGCRHYAR